MNSEESWGKPLSALLGALKMQVELGLPSIGGKDSMSGTFQNINVPPMLMAFGITTVDTRTVISPEFKKAGNKLYLIKHTPLNNYVSLYASNDDENKDGKTMFMDLLSAGEISNPENLLIDRENVKRIENLVDEELSSFEKQVFDLYITGMKYGQIAKVLGKDEKSTDNALQRIKTKLRKALL